MQTTSLAGDPTLCPGCGTPFDVQPSHGWPYVRTAVLLHLEVCKAQPCAPDGREACAEAIADAVCESKLRDEEI